VVITEVFQNLAGTAARAHGYPEMRTFVLPHPMEGRTEDDIRAIVRPRLRELLALVCADI
jgi:hypothetical protein